MIKVLVLFLFSLAAHAYVPTVESLFRHGANADVSGNGISFSLQIKKITPTDSSVNTAQVLAPTDQPAEDFYKVFFTQSGDGLKVAQTRYTSGNFSESALVHKTFFSNFTPFSLKPNLEESEKGIFYGMLHALAYNSGVHIIGYLKSLGIPVRLNNEIINREKIELLADYKRYLVLIAKDRSARKTEVNPLTPQDPAARDRVETIKDSSMYSDLKQVKIHREDGEMVWKVEAANFEAIFSYKERNLKRIKYKTSAGEYEIFCRDYWLANGTHLFPRYILIKSFSGQLYQLEVTGLRHYLDREDDVTKRLRNWDMILKGKEASATRPEFLL
jgi:hypothetical protein